MAQGNSGHVQGDEAKQEAIVNPAEEEIYAGTKIDSEEEAVASDEALKEAATAGATILPADMAVPDTVYTLDMWRVQPGQNAAFVAAWNDLDNVFRELPPQPADQRVLVQSISEPDLYYSIEPWQSLADIESIRPDAHVQAALAALRRYCSETTAGAYRVVAVGAEAEPQRMA